MGALGGYGSKADSTMNSVQRPGDALERSLTLRTNAISAPTTRSLNGASDEHLTRAGQRVHAGGDVDGDSTRCRRRTVAFAGVARTDFQSELRPRADDGRCPARTGDLLLVRREQLLRSTAACRSGRSPSDRPHITAAFCCGLPLPQRFQPMLLLSRDSELSARRSSYTRASPSIPDESLTEIAAPRAVIGGRPRQPMRMSFLFTNSSAP